MSGPAELAIATGALLDAGLKATAVLGIGAATTLLLRRSTAANRHAVWALSLGSLPALLGLAHGRGPEIAVDQPWVAAVWLAGALAVLTPLALGLVRLFRLRWTQTEAIGKARVGVSAEISGPLTYGWLRPVVLLSAHPWSPGQREAALAHELAHVRRADWLVHVLTWVVCAVFWFNPLVWLAWRQLGLEAEHAADDAAIASGVAPSSLASLLLGIATTRPPRGALAAGSNSTSRRIRAILDPRPRHASRWPTALVCAVGLCFASSALGKWHPWTAPPEVVTCHPAPPGLLP